MCGRTALYDISITYFLSCVKLKPISDVVHCYSQRTLDPSVIRKACCIRRSSSKKRGKQDSQQKPANTSESKDASNEKEGVDVPFELPTWREHPALTNYDINAQYYSSPNVSPTKFTPVLFKDKKSGELILQPMMWSMIPYFHKGTPKDHKLSTNNCRLEGILESKIFRRVLLQRKTCVIFAQGFYEWKTIKTSGKGSKQPYFIFMNQDNAEEDEKKQVNVTDATLWNNGTWNSADGWTGPKPLMMAGLYDIWQSKDGQEVYSYSIITMESNDTLSWLHHRMPAILETQEEVQTWIEASSENIEDVLSILKPATRICWYPVTPKVGNSRYFEDDCMKEMQIRETKESSRLMSWLKRPSTESSSVTTSIKKEKIDQDVSS